MAMKCLMEKIDQIVNNSQDLINTGPILDGKRPGLKVLQRRNMQKNLFYVGGQYPKIIPCQYPNGPNPFFRWNMLFSSYFMPH